MNHTCIHSKGITQIIKFVLHVLACRLRTQLKATPTSGPGMKHISLQIIQTMLLDRFTPENISVLEATKIIHEAFPDTQHKRMSKDGVRSTYIVGIDMVESGVSLGSEEREQLHRRIRELEGQVEDLQRQVQELQSFQQLVNEAEKVLFMATDSSGGPNTVSRMAEFGLDTLVTDLEMYSPVLLQLFRQLGDTSRNRRMRDGCLCVEEIKSIISLCILLNARSNRFKGLQLLLSMVLVGKGAGKQVR